MIRLQRASNSAPVTLGKELGRGGEGAVYPVTGAPDLVAKIYLKPPTPAKADKLRAMSRSTTPALLRVAAWPVDLLTDESGHVRGFLMPKVSAREDVHELYSPKSRRSAFPTADFRFLVRVAANIARAFAQVHAQGNVIGDVNHGNALVGRDGTVVLIDCDSFQVRDSGRTFTCDVGVPLFTAPELAGQGFRGLRRSPDHDSFGLAVLIFHLLFQGRHPFAGQHSEGDMPIERAIAESRFVYGARAAELGMTAPPGTLALGTFGAPIAQLFEQAFAPPGTGRRPSATEWIGVLQALEKELAPCAAAPAHVHPRGGECCWCGLEQRSGVRLFGRQLVESTSAALAKLARLWDAVSAVPPPPSGALLRPVTLKDDVNPDPLGIVPRIVLSWGLVFMGLACLVIEPGQHLILAGMSFAAAVATRWKYLKSGFGWKKPHALEEAAANARARLAALTEEWNKACLDDRFDKRLEDLKQLKERLLAIPREREAHVKALTDVAAQRQRERFLDLFRLDKAKLPNVSPQEIAMLAAFEIETADDALRQRSGLPKTIRETAQREILAWANACARNFKFDATKGADPEDVREIDGILRKQQDQLLDSLSSGQEDLQRLSEEISARRNTTKEAIRKAQSDLAVAEKLRT